MRGRSAIAALDKLPILRCTLSTLSNRFNPAFFHAERAILTRRRKPMTDTAHPIRIRKIGHVGLYCRDLAKMVDFYTRVLGFKVSDVNEKGMTFLRRRDAPPADRDGSREPRCAEAHPQISSLARRERSRQDQARRAGQRLHLRF